MFLQSAKGHRAMKAARSIYVRTLIGNVSAVILFKV